MVEQWKVIQPVITSLGDELSSRKIEIPPDILDSIRADKEAWENFQKFPEPYKRIRVGFIEGARDRPAEFNKRLNYFVKMSRKNKLFGFGGIDVYYRDSADVPARISE